MCSRGYKTARTYYTWNLGGEIITTAPGLPLHGMIIAGVDLGIKKIAISILWHGDLTVFIRDSKETQRRHQLHDLATYAHTIMNQHAVEYAFVEDTLVGNNKGYSISLSQTMGAVLSGLDYMDNDTQLVNVGTWKKQVTGNGNASKENVRIWVKEHYPAYAVTCGEDQDAFDATCIALFGVQRLDIVAELLEDFR